VDILGKWVHTKVQLLFPNNDAIFQDYNSFKLNIIKPLWSVPEGKVRSGFPPP